MDFIILLRNTSSTLIFQKFMYHRGCLNSNNTGKNAKIQNKQFEFADQLGYLDVDLA